MPCIIMLLLNLLDKCIRLFFCLNRGNLCNKTGFLLNDLALCTLDQFDIVHSIPFRFAYFVSKSFFSSLIKVSASLN